MNIKLLWAVLIAVSLSGPALADNPPDAAHARDHEQTRQSNIGERDMVQQRDANYASGWTGGQAHGDRPAPDNYAARVHAYQHQMADYAQDNARYQQQMADWRHAVASCQAGDYSACDKQP